MKAFAQSGDAYTAMRKRDQKAQAKKEMPLLSIKIDINLSALAQREARPKLATNF